MKFLFMISVLCISLLFSAVNINKANSAQLETINGIGPTKAKEIIKYRKAHGPFKNVTEIVNVKGIGPKTLDKIKMQITVR